MYLLFISRFLHRVWNRLTNDLLFQYKFATFVLSVSEAKDLKEPVSLVIERELKTLLDGKDLKQFNSDFLEENSQSLLHRLSGKVPSDYVAFYSSLHNHHLFMCNQTWCRIKKKNFLRGTAEQELSRDFSRLSYTGFLQLSAGCMSLLFRVLIVSFRLQRFSHWPIAKNLSNPTNQSKLDAITQREAHERNEFQLNNKMGPVN